MTPHSGIRYERPRHGDLLSPNPDSAQLRDAPLATSLSGGAPAPAGTRFMPLRMGPVEDDREVIDPAREGTLRVLRAARDAGVKRVVMTSAFHAVGFGHPHTDRTFTEADWSVLDGPGVDAYGKSKILAERAAWDFVTSEGGAPELVTLLPVAMGPVMGDAISGSNHMVQRMLAGAMPGFPNMYVPIVDVRDVALAHVAGPQAPGRRRTEGSGRGARALVRTLAEHGLPRRHADPLRAAGASLALPEPRTTRAGKRSHTPRRRSPPVAGYSVVLSACSMSVAAAARA